jgi:hypothetical protein
MAGNNTRISLYHYIYLKIAKGYVSFIFYVFSSTKSEKNRAEQVLPGSREESGPNNVCTCK